MNKKKNTKTKNNVSKTKISEKETKNNGLAILFVALLGAVVLFLLCSNKKEMVINREGMPSEFITKGEYLQYLYLNSGKTGIEIGSLSDEAYDYLLSHELTDFLDKYDKNYEFTTEYFYNIYVYDKTDLKNITDSVTFEFAIRGIVEYTYTVAKGANDNIKDTKLNDSSKYKYSDDIKIYMNATKVEDQDFTKAISKDQARLLLEEANNTEAQAHYPEINDNK